MKARRVVITGIGVLTPVGNSLDIFWDSLSKGKSGIGKITCFDTTGFEVNFAGEVKGFEPGNYMDKKIAKRMDRYIQFAVAASLQALKDADLKINKDNEDDIGVIIGSGIGGLSTFEEQHTILVQKGPSRVSPFFIPMLIPNMASGNVAIMTGAKGPNMGICSACATGAHAIGESYRIIAGGEAKAIFCGAAEAGVTPMSVAGFTNMKALSTSTKDPEKVSRPFDLDRDGFVVSEGAGIIVLEELEHALSRGARIYAELIGYGRTGDAYHITAPSADGAGAVKAMRNAIRDAGINSEEITYVNAHGTSTPPNDKIETYALKQVFGEEHARKLAISSIKSMIGHTLGAAGSLELIALTMTVKDDLIPPTINYETPDPECDLDYVPNEARQSIVNVGMSNSFGFGGQNAVLIVKKYQ